MKKKIKYYSRKAMRLLLVIIFPAMLISLITLSKYKPVYSVKFRGESIGLVGSKEELESKIENMISEPQAPVKAAKLEEKPEFELKLANRGKIQTEEKDVLSNIQDNLEKEYEIYEIYVKDKHIGCVKSKKEAQELVNTAKKDLAYNNISFKQKNIEKDIKKELKKSEDINIAISDEVKKIKDEAEKARLEEEARIAKLAVQRSNANMRYSQMLAASVGSGNVQSIRSLGIIHPLKTSAYKISSPYGARWGAFHTGVDFGAGNTTPPIYSAAAGRVIYAGWNSSGYGNLIKIDHGNGVVTYYAHLSSIRVQIGQMVNKGDLIGIVGTTGFSTGLHLHFEIRLNGRHLNPVPFLPYY